MPESKSVVTNMLFLALSVTRAGSDIKSLEYQTDGNEEFVRVQFRSGRYRDVCVTADSGIALIKDVIDGIYEDLI